MLSSLMWSWLEQLREPVISQEDVETLEENNFSPQQALDSLDKVNCNTGNFITAFFFYQCRGAVRGKVLAQGQLWSTGWGLYRQPYGFKPKALTGRPRLAQCMPDNA